VCEVYNAIIVLLLYSFSLSLLPLSLPQSSIPLHILMLLVKAPVALTHQLDSLLIGSLKVYLATLFACESS
jgi:hypothetical protein